MVTLLGSMGDGPTIHVLDSLGHMVMSILMQHDGTTHEPARTLFHGAGKEVSENATIVLCVEMVM
jgi:hypothetical protein